MPDGSFPVPVPAPSLDVARSPKVAAHRRRPRAGGRAAQLEASGAWLARRAEQLEALRRAITVAVALLDLRRSPHVTLLANALRFALVEAVESGRLAAVVGARAIGIVTLTESVVQTRVCSVPSEATRRAAQRVADLQRDERPTAESRFAVAVLTGPTSIDAWILVAADLGDFDTARDFLLYVLDNVAGDDGTAVAADESTRLLEAWSDTMRRAA